MTTVLMTDRAWPEAGLERGILRAAGLCLVEGPAQAAAPEAIAALAAQHRPAAIMTCWAEISGAAIAASPALRLVARIGVGLDNIDRAAAAAGGVLVTNVPDYCVEEVSDHAVGMLLAWARGLVGLDRAVKAGRWDPAGAELRRVRDLTIGVAGYGRIGRRTVAKLLPYGARILVLAPHPPAEGLPAPVRLVRLAELLGASDALILHLPLTAQTRGMFDTRAFAAMRPGSLLVNVSRGALVDNAALLAALDAGPLGAAALDVVDGEPDPPRALLAHPKVVATPHVAFSSTASLLELRRRAAEEVVRVLSGQPPRHPCPPPGLATGA